MKRLKTLAVKQLGIGLVGLAGWGKDPAAPAKQSTAPKVAAGPAKATPRVDIEAIKALALDVLNAYKAKDLAKLAELGPSNAKDTLIFAEPRNPNYQTLLGDDSWRMKSLASWDGTLRKVRVGVNVIEAHYNDIDDKTTAVLELVDDGKRWHFHDTVREDSAKYPKAMGTLKIAPPAEQT